MVASEVIDRFAVDNLGVTVPPQPPAFIATKFPGLALGDASYRLAALFAGDRVVRKIVVQYISTEIGTDCVNR